MPASGPQVVAGMDRSGDQGVRKAGERTERAHPQPLPTPGDRYPKATIEVLVDHRYAGILEMC